MQTTRTGKSNPARLLLRKLRRTGRGILLAGLFMLAACVNSALDNAFDSRAEIVPFGLLGGVSGQDNGGSNPPPADVTTASATGMTFDTVRLEWEAVGADGLTGAATRYEIGYRTTAIDDDAGCNAATIFDPGVPSAEAGTLLTYDLTGLVNQTTYYFCIRAYDAEGAGDRWSYGVLSATTPEGTNGWSAWGAFGACSVNCGGGTMTQTRSCAAPADGCAGAASNTVNCNTHTCATNSKNTTFNAASQSLACDPGYHVTNVSCSPGQVAAEGFDYFCPVCACGALSRGGGYLYPTTVSNPGAGTSSGTCNMSAEIGPAALAPCQFYIDLAGRNVAAFTGVSGFFQSQSHSMTIACQETP